MFRRLLKYGEKVYYIRKILNCIGDKRKKPQIKTSIVTCGIFIMALGKLGSLNKIERNKNARFWKKWIDFYLCSADTNGRVFALIHLEDIRKGLKLFYAKLKRNKVLKSPWHGLSTLIIDGHEINSSYYRCCEGCLKRNISTKEGYRVQYYHRIVVGMLIVGGDYCVLLDSELQLPKEDETSASIRLLRRMLQNFPRAFDVIIVDGLYAQAGFFKIALEHRKNVIAVLKDERRELLVDARALFEITEPSISTSDKNKKESKLWDIEELATWTQLNRKVRVVRSLETTTIKRQINGKEEKKVSDWIWVTTLSQQEVPTQAIVELGHKRWAIENQGFKELSNEWHCDHIYKHSPNAIIAFWLIIFLAYNLFCAFIRLNLKPELRKKFSPNYWSLIIISDLIRKISDIVLSGPL